jgi:uncharacterized membrane protein YbhN (UPF0104 family)/tRNA A-37 threonylcarbamoyl transferase component Bud32
MGGTVTATGVSRHEHPAAAKRAWNVALLTETEPGRRNRRTIDSVVMLLAAIVLGLSAAIASAAPRQDHQVREALQTVFAWAGGFWDAAFICALILALVVVVDVLWQRRWDLARDLVVAAVLLVGSAVILGGVVVSDWIPIRAHILSEWSYPDLRLAAATAVLVVVGPELVRSVRVLAFWLIPLAALGAVVVDAALPSSVLAALALALGAGSLVRLIFGTAAGVPPVAEVQDALASLGVHVNHLAAAAQQHMGSAEYTGREDDGSPLKVRLLGRDAQDTQRLARWWRSLAYRDPPRSVAVGRLEQVEHEALATLMASQAGVSVPAVVTAALGPKGDALIATRQPDIAPLEELPPEQVSDDLLRDICTQVSRLHVAGISHGRLNFSNVLVTEDGPLLVDFSAATLGAPQSALDIDVAELLVACTVLVGPDRALSMAVQAGWGDVIGRILPYLQRAALTPHLRDLARSHEVDIKDLRKAAAEASGQEAPDLVPLHRVRPKDVLMTVALIVAAYLLISKLADIGFGTIAHEVSKANPAWAVVGLILAQLALIGSGISMRGGVVTPLPLLPCVLEQTALKFINLAAPSSAGRIGLNLRFLQKNGVSLGEALAGGAVDDASNNIVQTVLLLIALPFVDFHLTKSALHGGVNVPLISALGAALVIGVILVLTVPKLRAKVVPPMKQAFTSLKTIARDRHKRLEVFGGETASELCYVLALGATCLAYGVHLNLAQLIFVNMAAAVLSGLIPVPGGIGAAEAALTAGLMAMGVDQPIAFAIAITQRLWTFYLPPIWGYASLRWLSRKGYV